MKQCFKCKEVKEESEFTRDKRAKDGLFSYCKACNSARASLAYYSNLAASRKRNRDRDAENRDKARNKCKSWWKEKRMTDPAYCLWAGAKARAPRKGLEFSIIREDITIPEYCPVLGIKLVFDNTGGFQDSSPSIDRIDSAKGYTPDNIIITSWRANRIKTDATIEELEKVIAFYKTL